MTRMKKEGNRPQFRSAAKRAAFEYLEMQLSNAHYAFRDNKFKINMLQKEQGQLKRDIAGLQQVMNEFKS